ncbi:MAG: DEAD/DEAH box helicase, partial [Erysipelotrichaceae bacterium]
MYIIKVLVGNKSLNVNRLYSYYHESDIEPYKRVNVIFNHQKLMALTVESEYADSLQAYEKKCGYKLSPVLEVIDNEPIINKLQFEEARWLSKTTVSPFISCLNTMLPKALRTLKNEIKPVYEQFIIKHDNPEYIFTPKQKEVYDACYDGMKVQDARKLSVSIVKKLIDNKLFEIIEKPREYKNKLNINAESFKELTADQKEVYDGLLNSDKPMNLLFGVTGAGKTEVYLHLARKYLEEGKQVLILVPEISLTPQMIERVSSRFEDVIFYHSALSDQQRFEQYLRVIKKEVRIVVGTRSSIFLPFDSLGLIIIDEEHDTSYTQDSTP